MQGKGKWQLEVKKYGYKQRKKKVLTLFESKRVANPYSLYLFAIIFLFSIIMPNVKLRGAALLRRPARTPG